MQINDNDDSSFDQTTIYEREENEKLILDTPIKSDSMVEQQTYSFYRYDWTSIPSTLLATTSDRYNKTCAESIILDQPILTRSLGSIQNNNKLTNNFFKSCQWSPDGTCLLTNSEDRTIRLFNIPSSAYDISSVESLIPSIGIVEAESICDLTWFPLMNTQDPTTCCFLSSVRDHPVRLWDATTGKVRASYSVVDHRERFIGPNVVKFNLDGTKIYCGYENMIEIFDLNTPGNNISTKIATTPNRKSKKGQKGIISCIDFNRDLSGMYAAGSYSQSIGIYDERTDELCLKLTGMKGGGVTQVMFSMDGTRLFSTCRQSNSILCWDIRQSANILYDLDRKGKTNQRVTFDLDPTGSVLISGDQDGNVLTYDLTTLDEEDVETKPRLLSSWKAHQDITSGATFNPVYPSILATCSGQRKFDIGYLSDSDDDYDMNEETVDNSLKLWQLAGQYEWYSMDMQITENDKDTTLC
ncbi:WD40-repeat-containing domain protein [Halteromyces radiatus]|uniref:WD40-repeat-containing domain protein n=1 Tax=Halteromyces radiatus TaxID=101107 RepID=UPI002220767C|nr:WD40-repeat-containing domain protein [Halteromyces radiatus]KAI8089540.1 WD40-repeat-containing domain protein [Halteromyces radiatus]